jgi:hypothetical protein
MNGVGTIILQVKNKNMKKLLILSVICIILSNCEIGVQKAKADFGGSNNGVLYRERDENINGMNYHIWYVDNGSSQTGYAVYAVNTTKDALECELLRKQLKSK